MARALTDRRDTSGPRAQSQSSGTDSGQSAVRTIPNVVLVESDVEVAALIELALVSAGYAVRTLHSGPAALIELIEMARDGRPRVLILSVDLVGLDGHTLHEQLRLAAPGSFTVAFLSARGSDADQIRAANAGAVDYLVKPVSLHVLIAKIAVWMTYRGVLS